MATQQTTKFWNMASVNGDEAEITLYGDVVSSHPVDWWTGELLPGLFITPEGFLEDLELVKDKSKITIKINSSGGDLYTGIAIHNALKGLKGHKTVIVEGIAASAASVIMCAGDDVHVYPGSTVMIHGVAGYLHGFMSMNDLNLAIKAFNSAEKAIAEIYKVKTGTDVDKLREMMSNELWMVGQEAIDNGFADLLISDITLDMSMSADCKLFLVAGVQHNVSTFKNIPRLFRDMANPNWESGLKNTITNQEGGKQSMETSEAIQATQTETLVPEAVLQTETIDADVINSAVTEAIANERKRIQDIEEIAPVIADSKLLHEAKYGDNPCSADELALKAMKAQAKLGATYLESSKKDFQDSGAGSVAATPNSGYAGQEESITADISEVNAVVAAYKQSKSGGKKQ